MKKKSEKKQLEDKDTKATYEDMVAYEHYVMKRSGYILIVLVFIVVALLILFIKY